MVVKWLNTVKERAEAQKDAGEPFGACLLPDPNGGPPICEQLDKDTCQNLGGTFLDGDCTSRSPVAPLL